MAKWNKDKTRIEYDSYDDFVQIQAGRAVGGKSTKKKFEKFDPDPKKAHDGHIFFDLKRLYPFLNKTDHILDLGSRDGWAIGRMNHDGYTNAIGLDLVSINIKACRNLGYNVYEGDCENMDMFQEGQFDVIFFRHTLEHVLHPDRAMSECRRVLKDGGIIDVVVPIERNNKKAHVKYGHSCVFTDSSQFYNLIKDWDYIMLYEKIEEKTPSGIASTFIFRVNK